MPKNPPTRPIIMYANHAELPPDFRLLNPAVRSRMLLWCRSGTGRIRINAAPWTPFAAGQFAWLPWEHRIAYHAGEQPWRLGGIHIVPSYPEDAHPCWVVHHGQAEWREDWERHRNAAWPELEGPHLGHFRDAPELEHLAEYVVGWFARLPRSAAQARELAPVVGAAVRAACVAGTARPEWPVALHLMVTHVRDHVSETMDMDTLARAGQCSAATAARQFRRYLGLSPMLWIQRERMARAAEYLRTTPLRIGEIGPRVGVPDPYYFSRLFRRWQGVSPTDYRRGAASLL